MLKYLFVIILFAIINVVVTSAQMQPININFAAVVGDKAFDCKETYEGIGTTKSKMTVSDFKI